MWKRYSLGRNNELAHFVKEEVTGLQVLSQLKQNRCFPGGKGWIQTADNLMRVYQSFYPVRSVRRRYSALRISLEWLSNVPISWESAEQRLVAGEMD